jgi:hypothetical protein
MQMRLHVAAEPQLAIMKLEGTAGGEHAAPAAGAAVPRRVSRRAISEK